jgi:hypothetical protein
MAQRRRLHKGKKVENRPLGRWATVLLLVAIGALVVGCYSDGLGGEEADVERAETRSVPGNPPAYYAIAYGHFPDECTSIGRTEQQVVSKTIMVTMYTRRADDTQCVPVLVPFREEVLLDVSGLSAGQYAVDVNAAVTTLNLREDH